VRHALRVAFIAAVVVLSDRTIPTSAQAQTLETAQQALQLISNTANDICQSAPLEQTNRGVDLSGEASAKVGGLVGRLADLGVTGAAQYRSGASKGVLQKDLIAAIQSANDCKLQVFKMLEAKLLAAAAPAARPPAPRPSAPRPAMSRCTVADPTGTPLNIREGPNGSIVGSLPNGFPVEVATAALQGDGNWVEIANAGAGQPGGWVYRPYIQCPAN
jgi:hypothetical protein